MRFSTIRILEALFTLIRKAVEDIIDYNKENKNFPKQDEVVQKYITK